MRAPCILVFLLALPGHALPRTRVPEFPLRFEANRGQEDARARFISAGPGYKLLLTDAGSLLSLTDGDRLASIATTRTDRRARSLGPGKLQIPIRSLADTQYIQ